MPFQRPPLSSPILASILAAGLIVTLASCSHLTPLGPGPVATTPPPQRELGSPIILQIMRSQPPTATGGCRAGWLAVPRGAAPTPCYRPAGTPPVRITSAAISPVVRTPSAAPQGKPAGPASYGIMILVPDADVAAVTALIRRAYDSRDALGVSIAGKLWEAPQVDQPFPGRQLEIAVPSRSQALRLYRTLVPPG
jgi:hypothetical protein